MASVQEKTLEELTRELPEELKREVQDFVEFLIEKKMPQRRKPTFSWWGAAEHLREKYTSVDLQHKITEWWSEDVSSGR